MSRTSIDRLSGPLAPVLLVVGVWSLAWKAIALWHAAMDGRRDWFVAIFVLNTAGILDIIYLRRFSRSWAARRRAIAS